MVHKPFFFSLLFTFLILGLGAFLNEGIAFFNVPFNSNMTHYEFYIIFTVNVLALILYFVYIFRIYRLLPSPWWIALMLILFIGNIVATYIFPSYDNGITKPINGGGIPWTYALTDEYRLRYVLSFLIACIDMYIVLAITPCIIRSSRSTLWLLYSTVFITFFFVIYSLVTETDVYAYYFDINRELDFGTKVAQSCLNNRNTFATVLLLGMCVTAIIHVDSPRWWNYLILFSLYFELFFVVSKTGIIVATVFIFAFVFYRFFLTIKIRPAPSIIGLVAYLASIIAVVLIGQWELLPRDSAFMKLYQNFIYALSRQMGDNFLEYRVEIWVNAVNYLGEGGFARIFFGTGEINSLRLLNEQWAQAPRTTFYYTHNGFVHQLFAGGVLRLTVYLVIIVYALYVIVTNTAKKHRTSIAYIFLLVSFLLHGITETTSFIGGDAKNLILMFLFYPPLFADRYNDTHPDVVMKKEEQLLNYSRTYGYEMTPERNTALTCMVYYPFILFFLAMVPFLSSTRMIWFHEYNRLPVQVVAIILLFYTPISFYLCFVRKKASVRGPLLISNIILTSASLILGIFLPDNVGVILVGSLLAMFLIILFIPSIANLSKGRFLGFFKAFVPLMVIALIVTGINHYLTYINKSLLSQGTNTGNTGFMFIEGITLLLLFFVFTPRRLFTYPLFHMIVHLDTRICYFGYTLEQKADKRYERLRGVKPVKAHKGKAVV